MSRAGEGLRRSKIRVRLVHWNEGEAQERARVLENLGYVVNAEVPGSAAFFKELAQSQHDVLVIDLSRIPSQGRDLAIGVRQQKGTRHIPLVFAGGDPVKLPNIKNLLPDAYYTDWAGIAETIRRALTSVPSDPVAPASRMAAYEGVPLAKRLGVKPGSAVALVTPPQDFRKILGTLPAGATLKRGLRTPCPVTLWFVRSREELEARLDRVQAGMGAALWICWPKKASGIACDLSQQPIRDAGLAAGLVDYKICSIDATWSGLCFAKRKVRIKKAGPSRPRRG